MKTERVLEFFERLADIALLSIIWTISSIPVISVGAATAAGYNTAIEVLRKKQHRVFPKFWKDFKAVFLQTLPFSFALLVLVLIFHLQMYLPKVNNIDNLYSFVLISQLVVSSFLITFFSYSYSLIGRFPLSNSQVISSAFKLCFCSLYKNIILVLSIVVIIILAVVYPPTLLLLPGLLFFSMTYLMEPQFHKIINYENDL